MLLEGKAAVATGAAIGGLGREIATKFAKRGGASVAIVDRNANAG